MFLIKEKRKNGTHLCIVQSYRDPVTKVSKKKRIMNIGYLEDLQKQYDDPIAYFQNVAKEMSEEEQNTKKKLLNIEVDLEESLEPGVDLIKNFGYTALSVLYHELKLDTFFRSRQRSLDIDYSLNSIMKLLVYSGILFPGTIKQTYANKDRFFDKMKFSQNDIYRSFSYFRRYRAQLQSWLNERICENYGRDKSQMYYFVTKHYFETGEHDELCKVDVSKARRQDPIVQMGLFVDNNGLPVSYELAPRNPGDMLLLNPEVKKVAQDIGVGRVILVGDNGNHSAEALYSVISDGDGYIVSQSIRSAEKEIKDYVLSQKGYVPFGDECKIKSRVCSRKLTITGANGVKRNVTYREKQIVFYNKQYARCATAQREDVLMKAKDLIASLDRYNHAGACSVPRNMQNVDYSKRAAELLQGRQLLSMDKDGMKEEERYDGYYLFLTSELEEKDNDIIDIYSDLWEIEESFKYINSTYRARPVYLTRAEHIHAHYTTCFISLLLTRILEMKTQRQYPLEQMLQSLRKCNYVHVEDNYYIQSYYDSVLDLVGKSVGVDFSKKYKTLCTIRENIGATKKGKK